jgi:hypothetical protein
MPTGDTRSIIVSSKIHSGHAISGQIKIPHSGEVWKLNPIAYYAAFLCLPNPTSPIRAVPNNQMAAGTGTGERVRATK